MTRPMAPSAAFILCAWVESSAGFEEAAWTSNCWVPKTRVTSLEGPCVLWALQATPLPRVVEVRADVSSSYRPHPCCTASHLILYSYSHKFNGALTKCQPLQALSQRIWPLGSKNFAHVVHCCIPRT